MDDRTDLPRERRSGHLTVLRSPRAITRKEFQALSVEDQLAVLRGASGRQKHDLLLEANHPELLVRRLPAQEIYLLIKELGLPDVAEFLSLADTDQITAFLDLDCWRGDLLDEEVALQWLAVLVEAGEEKILETAREIDFELLALIFAKLVIIVRGPEDYLDEDARLEAAQRDGGYELDFRDADSENSKLLSAILDIFLRRDPELFANLMGAIRWEQEAMLEEENLRRRNIRLQELGFPDPLEAAAIYAWLDPAAFDPADWRRPDAAVLPEGEAPAFMLSAARPRDLLADVLAGGIDRETAWELTWLLNRVMTADRIDVGSFERVQEETAEVYRTLNLALEHLCGGDAEKAAALFAGTYLQALFRLGFSLTLVLQRRARLMKKSRLDPWLDGPFRALVDALDKRKPRFFEGMEDFTRAGDRPFATLREVGLAAEWLDRLEVQRRLFEEKLPFELPAADALDLTGCAPAAPEDLALSDFFLTALANRVLGRPFLPQPVPAVELAALHGKVCADGVVVPELRQETARWLDSLEPGAGAFGHFCLDVWEEDFCVLDPAGIDPRYLSGLIVRVE